MVVQTAQFRATLIKIKMAKQEAKNPLKVVLGMHRVTYVHVKEPTQFEDDGPAKYDCTFLIPYDHPDVAKIKAAIDAAYAANSQSMFKGMPKTSPKLWNPLRDGAEWMEDHPEATEYEGHYFIKAASKSQPAVFDADGQDVIDLDEVYSGCYCRGVIVCYPFNNKSKGFGFYLNSLKKMEDGERLGGFAASHEDYDDEDYNEAPAPKATRPAPRAAAAPKKPERIFDEDAEGNQIYSDDNGENWFFV